jgi:hypothetical protein
MVFLLKNTREKVDYMKILSDFDELKNKFVSYDKKGIVCSNININTERELDIECNVYSTDRNNDINDINKVLKFEG